jgi:hypothetical protein
VALVSGSIAGYTVYHRLPVTMGLVHPILDTNFRESFEVMHRHIPATVLSIFGFFAYLMVAVVRTYLKIKL